MEEIKKESEEVVEPKKWAIEEEEEKANAQAQEAHAIKVECETELEKAMPMVHKAIAALNTIKPKDIIEIKALGKPPTPIKKVLHAVCIMCHRTVEKTPKKDNPKEKEENWWLTATKFMSEKDFLEQLIKYDWENIPDSTIKKIRKQFIPDGDFKPSRVEKASQAAKGLCLWVRALDEFDKVNKFVAPKRERAREAEAKYGETKKLLAERQEELKAIVKQFQELQDKLDMTSRKKKGLEDDILDCEVKLKRA